ncbi:glutamate receptor ionotropic, delta-2-like [Palaemon carinicauda]|uniref:glutamate receptor ionotropic, delta-2-like n=1 Tax=Palaemon carinicauda TaxID=392227 RepID=UPI0035B69BE5
MAWHLVKMDSGEGVRRPWEKLVKVIITRNIMPSLIWRRLLLYSIMSNELLLVNGLPSIPLIFTSGLENSKETLRLAGTNASSITPSPADGSIHLSSSPVATRTTNGKLLAMNATSLNKLENFSPISKAMESNALTKVLKKQEDDDLTLTRLFILLVKKEFKYCDLIVASDKRFFGSPLLEYLASLPNYKQVIAIGEASDLKWVDWASPRCHGVILLISDPAILIEFSNVDQAYWDYKAKFVIAGLSAEQLNSLVQPNNRKIMKTTHILGIVQGERPGHYNMYMNALYWGGGLRYIATWKGQQSYKMPEVFPDKIRNIRKHVLNVTMFEFPPNIMFRRDSEGNIIFRYGFEVDIIYGLAEVFNFTVHIKDVSPTELWGKKQPDGTFTGLVGRLGNMEADFGVGNVMISISSGRTEFIEFSTSYLNDEACLLARVEPPLPRWQSISLPFTLETWMAILIGLILAGPVMYVIAKISSTSGTEHQSYTSLLVTLLNSFGLLVRQGVVYLPIRASNRVFVLFLLFYVFIITTAYSSNLTAFLTVVRQPPGVESFFELYKSKLDLFALGPFLKSVLANSGSSYHRALSERFYIIAFPEIRKHILSGRGVMINGRGYLEFARDQLATPKGRPRARLVKTKGSLKMFSASYSILAEENPVVHGCPWHASLRRSAPSHTITPRRECFAPFSVATAFQIYSPLRDRFSRVLDRLLETGILRRWYLDGIRLNQKFKQKDLKEGLIQPEQTEEEEDGSNGVIPLGIDHLQGAFIILTFGCLLSLLAFILEIRCSRKESKE